MVYHAGDQDHQQHRDGTGKGHVCAAGEHIVGQIAHSQGQNLAQERGDAQNQKDPEKRALLLFCSRPNTR